MEMQQERLKQKQSTSPIANDQSSSATDKKEKGHGLKPVFSKGYFRDLTYAVIAVTSS